MCEWLKLEVLHHTSNSTDLVFFCVIALNCFSTSVLFMFRSVAYLCVCMCMKAFIYTQYIAHVKSVLLDYYDALLAVCVAMSTCTE